MSKTTPVGTTINQKRDLNAKDQLLSPLCWLAGGDWLEVGDFSSAMSFPPLVWRVQQAKRRCARGDPAASAFQEVRAALAVPYDGHAAEELARQQIVFGGGRGDFAWKKEATAERDWNQSSLQPLPSWLGCRSGIDRAERNPCLSALACTLEVQLL